MSNGGLLEKAAKQQTGDANLGVPPNTVSTTDEEVLTQQRGYWDLFLGDGCPIFCRDVVWWGFLGDDTTTVSVGFLSFLVLAIAGTGIWFISGRPAPASIQTVAIGLTFILLLSSNYAIALLLTGEMSLGRLSTTRKTMSLLSKSDKMVAVGHMTHPFQLPRGIMYMPLKWRLQSTGKTARATMAR